MKRLRNLPRFPSSLVAASLLVAVAAPQAAWGADEKSTPPAADEKSTPPAAKEKLQSAPPSAESESAPSRVKASRDAGGQAQSEADQASDRENKSRTGGHTLIADRLAALAKMWLRVAVAQRKAAALELQADALERETIELEAQARRGASLVEQTDARRARALGRLQELGLVEELEKTTPPPAPADPAATTEGAAQ